jgi:DNA invertase Pin-like site-specific DNA recombinase
MRKIIAYLRASTDKQDVKNQKLEILEFSRNKKLYVDDFIEITISSRKTTKQRRIDELLEKLNDSDTLIVTELSRLGRSTAEVIALMNELSERDIRVIIIKQNLDISRQTKDMTATVMITLLSLFSELERDFVSIRTKEALKARKAQGVILGKPKGTVQNSKFDKDKDRIQELLGLGLSVRKITKLLGYSNHIGLNTYVRTRKLKV